jgi:PAS domain S-box-containing protein
MGPSYKEIFNRINHFGAVLTPDGTVRTVNDAILDFTGNERKGVIGRKLWEAPGIRSSETSQSQVRADVQRAANNEYVSHELTIQGAERTAVIDFSLQPLTDEHGDVKHILAEGSRHHQIVPEGEGTLQTYQERTDTNLLVKYTRDPDEPMSQALLQTFLAVNIDIFEKDSTLESQINTDSLNRFDWGKDCPHSLLTHLWGYRVEISSDEVRIFNDSTNKYKYNP